MNGKILSGVKRLFFNEWQDSSQRKRYIFSEKNVKKIVKKKLRLLRGGAGAGFIVPTV